MRLVIFDVDGTLVDSQAHILAAMAEAFATQGLAAPTRRSVLGIVGLSLPQAMARLAPDAKPATWDRLVAAYKAAFAALRGTEVAQSPLYPGAAEVLRHLAADPSISLAVATGKSRRGMEHVLALHDLEGLFDSVQTADAHPSKPHPSMIEACLAEYGAAPDDTVMIGDTVFDMDMARAAGVTGLGVAWGYHDVPALNAAGAAQVLDRFDQLLPWLDAHWGPE